MKNKSELTNSSDIQQQLIESKLINNKTKVTNKISWQETDFYSHRSFVSRHVQYNYIIIMQSCNVFPINWNWTLNILFHCMYETSGKYSYVFLR